MMTVLESDVKGRIAVLQARKSYVDALQRVAPNVNAATLYVGEMVGLDAGIKILRELEEFFANPDPR